MQVQVVKKKAKSGKDKKTALAAVLYVIALALMPMFVYAQQQDVTKTEFWEGLAKGVVTFMKTMLAIAFWGSLALLLVYAVVSWLGPTKFTRLGAMYDFIDTVKGWLLATFIITAGIVGLITGFTAITSAFGGSANVNAVDVLTNLLIKPITDMIGITQG
ncbi:MAG: hypothetical protein QW247_11565 [Pyrobaculum sp.]|uniref:hypothetical protein n=1 Tax=Pyrobaculum sp. TaxID=2004705 RepID=UPI0031604CC9